LHFNFKSAFTALHPHHQTKVISMCSGLTRIQSLLKSKAPLSKDSAAVKSVLKFMGRVIGLALAEEMALGVNFSTSFCKALLWNTREDEIGLEDLKVVSHS
jgi:ABC-type maltose transport system permease subunit